MSSSENSSPCSFFMWPLTLSKDTDWACSALNKLYSEARKVFNLLKKIEIRNRIHKIKVSYKINRNKFHLEFSWEEMGEKFI